MKKTFLSLIFAITMGVSLFAGTLKNATAQEVDHNISLLTSQTHTFSGSSIEIIEGDSVRLEGNTIIPTNIGQSKVEVDDVEYIVDVNLPSAYTVIDYVEFPLGASIDTGCVFNFTNNDMLLKLHYSGIFADSCFGFDSKDGYFFHRNGTFLYNRNSTPITVNLNVLKEEKTLFQIISLGNSFEFTFGEDVYQANLRGSLNSTSTFCFGNKGGDWAYGTGKFKGTLYDLCIESGGIPICNLVPCELNSSSTIGFYDVITNTFHASYTSTALTYDFFHNFYYQDIENTRIKENNGKMVLSSSANFSDMDGCLNLPKGSVLTGTISGKTIEEGKNKIDLTTLFGPMTVATEYPLTVTCGNHVLNVSVIKTDAIPNLYLEIADSYTSFIIHGKSYELPGSITLHDGETVVSERLEHIHGRGNHFNQTKTKNSFSIKLEEKKELIKDAGKQKKYNLVGLNSDNQDYMAEQVGYTLYQQICPNNEGVQFRMVNLYWNGASLGLYMLTEKTEISPSVVDITKTEMNASGSPRVVNANSENITEDEQAILDSGIVEYKYCPASTVETYGGYMIEAGFYYAGASSGFITSHDNRWEIKDPEGLSLSQIGQIATFIQEAEDALFSPSGFNSKGKCYNDYYDLDSIAREFLVRAFILDRDFYVTSNYLFVDADNNGPKGKIGAGPVWDLNITLLGSRYDNLYFRDIRPGIAYKFMDQLMTKGDFISTMANINAQEFKQLVANMVDENYTKGPTVHSFYNDFLIARQVDELLHNNGVVAESLNQKNRVINRSNYWYNIWSDGTNALRGITIEKNENTFTASNVGATSIQWYKVNSDNSVEKINEATSASYTPTESGIYYCQAKGKALSGTSASTLNSNPIKYSKVVNSSSYSSLTEALNNTMSGDTLILDLDYNVNTNYTINSGIILDLNGHNILNAQKITVDGQIMDSNPAKGIISSEDYSFGDEQKYLPINDSLKGGYAFYDVSIQEQISGTNKLQFRMTNTSQDCKDALDLIGNNIVESRVKSCVTVSWKDYDSQEQIVTVSRTISFNDSWMSYVILGNDSSEHPEKTYNRVFNFTISNLADLIALGKVTMQCCFVTYFGNNIMASVEGKIWKTTDGLVWYE